MEHKSARVLSATADENQSQRENPIRQVTVGNMTEDQDGISKASGHEAGGRERNATRGLRDQKVKSIGRILDNPTPNVVSLFLIFHFYVTFMHSILSCLAVDRYAYESLIGCF